MRETDHLKKLSDYMKRNLAKGYDDDSLKWALINQGHSRASVEKAIEVARYELAHEAGVSDEKPVITHEVVTDDSSNAEGAKKSWWKSFFGLE